MTEEWGKMVIGGWNRAGWIAMPTRIGDRIGRLIGAPEGTVVMGDTLSVKVYQALASALELRPDRKVILSDSGNFPSDLYMADGLVRTLAAGHELRVVAPEEVEANITEDLAVLMLTEVDYRTGRRHDMKALTARAHAAGALAIWDLAHSAGALPVDLLGADADFAVGCTYKYLNGGPGAPAFIYVKTCSLRPGPPRPLRLARPRRPLRLRPRLPPRPRHRTDARGHAPHPATRRARRRPRRLGPRGHERPPRPFHRPDASLHRRDRGPLPRPHPRLAPRPGARGSQVSFRHPEGYAIMQALIATGVVGDFRAPDILRFGFTPLFIDLNDVRQAAEILENIMATGSWNDARFHRRAAVT
jgi:kynureninase